MKGPHDGEPPRVFVLEDIDCLFENREAAVEVGTKSTAPRRSTVTLSGLLNVLDGMGSPINVLIIMTTNYADRLDAALLRPGRVDTRFRVEPPSDAQIGVHYNKFFPDASRLDKDAFVLSCRQKYPCACSMAQVQALILAEHDKE
jgi:SpoVK/Ycf46/Vps4 family AAA+-type ATPase